MTGIQVTDHVRLAGPGPWQRRVHVEPVWGTVVTFDLRADRFPADTDAVVATAVAFLHEVDRLFSTFRVESAISMLRSGLIAEAEAPAVVRHVLGACRRARHATDGVFDPWAVRGGVDPSGYVKGWAAGVVADRFVRAGLANVAVNASGDVACRGFQAPGEPWAIGITDPADTQRVVAVVHLLDEAVATSGLYERGAHILDPRTGRAEVRQDSATVVGPDAGLADAFATAALIAGPDCARWFAGRPDWSVYLVRDRRAAMFGPAFPATASRT